MLEYRRAGPADAGALVDLRIDFMRIVKVIGAEEELAWRSELAPRLASDLESGRMVSWVCVDRGEAGPAGGGRLVAAGGLAVGPPAAAPGEGLVFNMYTLPQYRRRGIGAELLSRAIADARSLALARLTLQPTDDGRGIYEAAGFEERGREMVLELGPGGRAPPA